MNNSEIWINVYFTHSCRGGEQSFETLSWSSCCRSKSPEDEASESARILDSDKRLQGERCSSEKTTHKYVNVNSKLMSIFIFMFSSTKAGHVENYLDVLQSLLSHQLFFFIPIHGCHQCCPDLRYEEFKITKIKNLHFSKTTARWLKIFTLPLTIVTTSYSTRLYFTEYSFTSLMISLAGLFSARASATYLVKSFFTSLFACKGFS